MLGAAREVTPSIQPGVPDVDQLKVVPNRAWSRDICKLPQPCHRQTWPKMGATEGKKKKYSTLFYCLAWATQWGSAHVAAICSRWLGSQCLQCCGSHLSHCCQGGLCRSRCSQMGAWWAPSLLFCSVAFCITYLFFSSAFLQFIFACLLKTWFLPSCSSFFPYLTHQLLVSPFACCKFYEIVTIMMSNSENILSFYSILESAYFSFSLLLFCSFPLLSLFPAPAFALRDTIPLLPLLR